MLQVINRYYRSFLGTFFIILIGLSMLLFGVDFGGRPTQTYAIKVNEAEVSFAEFYERKSEVQAQLARNLGANYAQFAAQLLENLNQRLTDELIEETLIRDIALQLGFSPGKRFVQGMIQQLFPDGFSPEKYRSLLQQLGTSAPQFENRLASETLVRQIRSLFQQLTLTPPEAFVKADFLRKERSYSLETIEFNPKELTDKVPTPSEDTLKKFYEDNIIEYEQDPRVKVSYLSFPPQKFEDKVEVFEEDIEIFYTDNQRRFTTPERVKIQEIVLNLPENDQANAIGVQSLANELMEKIENGEDFVALAKEYSDDKAKGEVSDWIPRGTQSSTFDEQLYGDENENSDVKLIEEPKKLRLVKQSERELAAPRPLDEVKDEILAEIKKREAPIYAAEVAREEFDKWQNSETPLTKVGEDFKLPIQKIEKLTSLAESTPANRDIIRTAIESLGESKVLVDVGNSLALVEVEEYRESEFPALDEVRKEVTEDFVLIEAQTIAANKANEFFQEISTQDEFKGDLAKKYNGKVNTIEGKKTSEFTPPLSSSLVRDKILSTQSPGIIGDEPFTINENHYVFWLKEITDPKAEDFEKKEDELENQATTRLAQVLEQSFLNHLRANANIDVHPSVYEE